jgi:hypothetical protein
MRYGYFDGDGICCMISTQSLDDSPYAFEAEIEDEGKPSDFWLNPTTQEVIRTWKIEDIKGLVGAVDTMNINQDYHLTIPDNCVLEIDGSRYYGTATLNFDSPKKVFVFLKGAQVGDCVVSVNSYVEDRVAAYPTVQEQLDMLYHLGFDQWKTAIAKIKQQFPKG